MAKTPRAPGAAPAGQALDTAPAGAPPKDHDLAPRFSFPTTRDGKQIAFKKLQPRKKDELRQLLSDPALPAELGITLPALGSAAPAGQGLEAFPPELCGVLYDALSMVLAWYVQNHRGATPEQAEAIKFTTADKAKVNEPTAKVIDKYFPGGLNKYGEEAALLVALGTVAAGKLTTIRAITPSSAAAVPPPPAAAPGPQLVPPANTDFSPAVNS